MEFNIFGREIVFEVKNNCTGIIKQIKKNGEYKKGNTYCGY